VAVERNGSDRVDDDDVTTCIGGDDAVRDDSSCDGSEDSAGMADA
jgi:hypothetical protein